VLPPLAERVRHHLGIIPSGERRTSWWVLRNGRFRLYFYGSVVSDLGTWLQNTAQVLLAYQLAHSVLMVGIVTCAQFSSPLVLSPFAGAFTERFGGRRTLLGTQVVAALIAAALGFLEFTGRLNEWWLGTGAFLSGLCFAFALPARNVTVRRLTAGPEVKPAFTMDSVSYNLGRAIAPLISVGLVHWVGYGWAFAANSASFLAFIVVLWRVGRNGSTERKQRSGITAGFKIAATDGRIMILLLMVAAVTVCDDPILVLGPALAARLHVSPGFSGGFIAALGVGSVLGSFRRSKHRPSLRLAATVLALLGVCMVFFVGTNSALISLVAACGAGVTCLIANAATRTLLSDAAGPEREAIVMAVWAIAWAGSKPFASLTDGLLAGWVGIRWDGLILAIPALIPFTVLVLMPKWGHRLADRGSSSRPAAALGVASAGALASGGELAPVGGPAYAEAAVGADMREPQEAGNPELTWPSPQPAPAV
jgi:MFS family permease